VRRGYTVYIGFFQVQVEVILYNKWGWIQYQSRVIVRVREIIRVKLIVWVEVIPYTFCTPESKLKQCHIIGEGAFHIRVEWLSELGTLSESKLYLMSWVSSVKFKVMMDYQLGCIVYMSRVVVRVMEIVTVKVIVRVILYMLGFPCHTQSYSRLEHIQSKFYRFHKLELIFYNSVRFE